MNIPEERIGLHFAAMMLGMAWDHMVDSETEERFDVYDIVQRRIWDRLTTEERDFYNKVARAARATMPSTCADCGTPLYSSPGSPMAIEEDSHEDHDAERCAQALVAKTRKLEALLSFQKAHTKYWAGECDVLREEMGRIKRIDTSWPLIDVLRKLNGATRHLLAAHDCDALGHEEIRRAQQEAEEIIEVLATQPEERPRTKPVTDPLLDAPDGAIVDGYERVGDTWRLLPKGAGR